MKSGAGRLPLPTGAVKVQNLTPAERRKLESMGLGDLHEIPENLADITEAALQETSGKSPNALLAKATKESIREETTDELVAELQARLGRGFKPVTGPAEIDIAQLAPEKQQLYRDLIAQMLQQRAKTALVDKELQSLRNLPPSVQQAVESLDEPETPAPNIVDDLKSRHYDSGAERAATVETPDAAEAPADNQLHANCARCGFPKQLNYDVTITDAEKDQYLMSMQLLRPFEYREKLFGGRWTVTLRALTVDDADRVWQQLLRDELNKRIVNVADKMEFSQRYRLALSLIRLETDLNVYTFPNTFEDWNPAVETEHGKLYDCWMTMKEALSLNESSYRVLSKCVLQFSAKMQKLEALADDENFYKAGTTA